MIVSHISPIGILFFLSARLRERDREENKTAGFRSALEMQAGVDTEPIRACSLPVLTRSGLNRFFLRLY